MTSIDLKSLMNLPPKNKLTAIHVAKVMTECWLELEAKPLEGGLFSMAGFSQPKFPNLLARIARRFCEVTSQVHLPDTKAKITHRFS